MFTATETTVLDRIDGLADELIAFQQQLVRIPTVNPPGENYAECAQLIGNKLRACGYQRHSRTARHRGRRRR